MNLSRQEPRQAKIDLLEKYGDEAVPYYWKGFTLHGEGASTVLNRGGKAFAVQLTRCKRNATGVLYRIHMTLQRSWRNKTRSLAVHNLRTNGHPCFRPPECGLRVIHRNYLIES
jgi:hypothetical protein